MTQMNVAVEVIETVTQIKADEPCVLVLKPRDLSEDEPWTDSFYETEAVVIVAFLDRFFCRRTISEIKRRLGNDPQRD